MQANGHLQVVVADFEERQRPKDEDGQERSRDNEHHCTRNAICNLLTAGLSFFYFKSNAICIKSPILFPKTAIPASSGFSSLYLPFAAAFRA